MRAAGPWSRGLVVRPSAERYRWDCPQSQWGTVGHRRLRHSCKRADRGNKTECVSTTVVVEPLRTIGDVESATAGWVNWYTTGACTAPLD